MENRHSGKNRYMIHENTPINYADLPYEGAVIKPENFLLHHWKRAEFNRTTWNYISNRSPDIKKIFKDHFKVDEPAIFSPLLDIKVLDYFKMEMVLHLTDRSCNCTSYMFTSKDGESAFLCHAVDEDKYIEIAMFWHFCEDYNEAEAVKKVIELSDGNYIFADEEPTIYLITRGMGGYDLDSWVFDPVKIDLENNYNAGFREKVHDPLIKLAHDKEAKKGKLAFLHGPAGTGKSFYLKHLIAEISKKAKVIYVPNYLVESIADPSFIDFIREQSGSWLIVEDGEAVICNDDSRERSAGTSNLLQVTDGILGDILDLKILITFNTELDKVDTALKRSGRMYLEYKFDELGVEKADNKLDELGFEKKGEKMTLADIYNLDHENKRSDEDQEPEKGVMGFGV